MRARLLKPMHRGQLPALRCRHARVDGLQRLSGRLALPQAGTPSPSCRRPGANPRPWTKISMGTRAHTTPIAPTRRPSSAPRSALRAALRVTGHRSWRSHTTRWPSPGHPPNNFTHTSLTRPDCTDKRNGGDRQRSPDCRRRGASRDWRIGGVRGRAGRDSLTYPAVRCQGPVPGCRVRGVRGRVGSGVARGRPGLLRSTTLGLAPGPATRCLMGKASG